MTETWMLWAWTCWLGYTPKPVEVLTRLPLRVENVRMVPFPVMSSPPGSFTYLEFRFWDLKRTFFCARKQTGVRGMWQPKSIFPLLSMWKNSTVVNIKSIGLNKSNLPAEWLVSLCGATCWMWWPSVFLNGLRAACLHWHRGVIQRAEWMASKTTSFLL